MAALAAGAAAVPATSAQAASGFSDVPATYEFAASVDWMVAKGIAEGWPDRTFRPHAPVERGAFAAFLYRLAGKPAYLAPETPQFSDVPASHPFYKEISWAAQYGITTGWPDRTFRPSATIKRDAIAAFMYRMACQPAYSAPADTGFRDVARNRQFAKEISWAKSAGLLGGWSDGTFRPLNDTERGAVAVMLHRTVVNNLVGAPKCVAGVKAQAPTFEDSAGSDRDIVRIPDVAGVSYFINGVRAAPGPHLVTGYDSHGQTTVRVDASPVGNRYLEGGSSWHRVFSNARRATE